MLLLSGFLAPTSGSIFAQAKSTQAPATPAPAKKTDKTGDAKTKSKDKTGTAPKTDEKAKEESLISSTLALDIATASFYELVDWANSLKIDSSGTASQIRDRLYQKLKVKPPAQQNSGQTVRIENASKAEYFKLDNEGEGIMHISGGAILTIRDEKKNETSKIIAQDILYDKNRNTITARGDVYYRRETASDLQEFKGNILTANLDNANGIFLDGHIYYLNSGNKNATGFPDANSGLQNNSTTTQSTQSDSSSTNPPVRGFYFQSDNILKREGNTLILNDAVITSSQTPVYPHYSIHAKKMWLLGGSDWAMSDAVLFIGEIPVFWFPYIFYPGDEIVFHPVFGTRPREGNFVQTTTYIIGQKAQTQQTGVLSISASGNSKKELHGLFLRPGSESLTNPSYLKVLFDAYSNLGVLLGIDGNFPTAGIFSGMKWETGLAFSRSVYAVGTNYSPFISANNFVDVWNTSLFLGQSLPFRFGGNYTTNAQLAGVSMNILLSYYSDPYFNQDFRYRSEDLDWLSLFTKNNTTNTQAQPGEISSLEQKVNFSYSLSPAILAPYLNNINLSYLTFDLLWKSKNAATTDSTVRYNVDPNRKFFYPDILKPLSSALTLQGDLWPKLGASSSSGPSFEYPNSDDNKLNTSLKGVTIKSPWETSVSPLVVPDSHGDFKLASRLADVTQDSSSPNFSLAWSFTPSFFNEQRFKGDLSWLKPSDIDYAKIYTLNAYQMTATLAPKVSFPKNYASTGLTLTYTGQEQFRETTDDTRYTTQVNVYKLEDYRYRQRKLTGNYNLSINPFAQYYLWNASSVSYNIEGIIYRYYVNPQIALVNNSLVNTDYKEETTKWTRDYITTHNVTATAAIHTGDYTQSLALVVSIPPLFEAYSTTLNLAAGYEDFSINAVATGKYSRPSDTGDLKFEPFTGTLSLKLPLSASLSDSVTFDSNANEVTSNRSSAVWGPLTVNVNAAKNQNYKPVIGLGWQAYGDNVIRLSDYSIVFAGLWKTPLQFPVGINILSNVNFNQNLLRFSESVLTLSTGLSFNLPNFFTLQFAITSQNSSVWRYWPSAYPGVQDLGTSIDGQHQAADIFYINPYTDIVNSITFWDQSAQRSSNFKLKSVSAKITHDLDDWDLSAELTISPKLDTVAQTYSLDPSFTFALRWRDIPPIKTVVTRTDTVWTFN